MPLRNRRGFLSCILGSAWAGASLLERASLRAADARARSWQAPATLFDLETRSTVTLTERELAAWSELSIPGLTL